jgi:hypothetical protein
VPLTVPHAKETLCAAHIYGTAGMARVNLSVNTIFDYGVDGFFEDIIDLDNGRLRSSPYTLAYQAKATVDWWEENEEIVYDLEAAAYNDIATRPPGASTMILLLLCLPKEMEKWHSISHIETTIRNCCYWHVFRGEPTPNEYKKRIHIPKENLFTPDALKELLVIERERLSQW